MWNDIRKKNNNGLLHKPEHLNHKDNKFFYL